MVSSVLGGPPVGLRVGPGGVRVFFPGLSSARLIYMRGRHYKYCYLLSALTVSGGVRRNSWHLFLFVYEWWARGFLFVPPFSPPYKEVGVTTPE